MLFWFSIKAQSFTGLISMACFMWEAWICEVFKTCLKLCQGLVMAEYITYENEQIE